MFKTITVKFDNQKAAEHFQTWLCEQGEQDYWQWMEYREEEEGGNITAIYFEYNFDDGTVSTTCSRLDGES